MSGPRKKRVFGPLFYSTLAVAALAVLGSGIVIVRPRIEEWRELRSLASTLRGDHPRGREAAAAALLRKGPEVFLPYMLEAARDPRTEVRALACRSLADAQVDPRVSVPVLTAAAGDPRWEVRQEAARGFGYLPNPAAQVTLSPYSGAPGNLDPGLRTRCLASLRRLLKDREAPVRSAAADALAGFGPDPEAGADLIAAADDDEWEVRLAAARALLKVRGADDPTAARTLATLVAAPGPIPGRRAIMDAFKDAGKEAQDRAAGALAEQLPRADPVILPDMIDCLASAGPRARAALPALEALSRGEDRSTRGAATLAIVEIEGRETPRALGILIGMVADPSQSEENRILAFTAARQVQPAALAKATPDLIRQLGSADPNVRAIAMRLLSEIVSETPALMPPAAE